MKCIALLTAGSSLKRLWSNAMGAQYASVIAVNCAAQIYECDKALALDKWAQDALEAKGIEVHPIKGRFAFAPLTFPCALKMACAICDETESELHIYGLDMSGQGLNVNDPVFDDARIKRELMWIKLALDGCKCDIRIYGDVENGIRNIIERPMTVEYEESMK